MPNQQPPLQQLRSKQCRAHHDVPAHNCSEANSVGDVKPMIPVVAQGCGHPISKTKTVHINTDNRATKRGVWLWYTVVEHARRPTGRVELIISLIEVELIISLIELSSLFLSSS